MPSVELAHDDEVDPLGPRIGEHPRHARNGADRAHPGVEPEGEAHVELRRDLGAVRVADVGPAHGAEEDRVGLSGARHAVRRQDRAGVPVVMGAAGDFVAAKGEAEARLDGVEHGERRRHDLDADALAGHDGDAECVRFHGRARTTRRAR